MLECFSHINISALHHTVIQVLELLQEAGDEGFDAMCLLRTLGQVKTDVVDSKVSQGTFKETKKTNKEWLGD